MRFFVNPLLGNIIGDINTIGAIVTANILNIILLMLFSFILALIIFFAKFEDKKIAEKLDN